MPPSGRPLSNAPRADAGAEQLSLFDAPASPSPVAPPAHARPGSAVGVFASPSGGAARPFGGASGQPGGAFSVPLDPSVRSRLPDAAPTPPSAPDAASAVPTWAPVLLQHPQAQHRVKLRGHSVGYAFRRARRRSIGFVIGLEGLSVSAPRWVSMAEVEQALQGKADWILRKLQEQHERARRMAANRMRWREGEGLPFLGETAILVLDPRVTGVQLRTAEETLPGVPRLTLHVGLPQAATEEQVREAVQAWLQRQARRVFQERCDAFAPQLGVSMRRMSLSSASTRWGSASADGSVRLNWRLIHFAMPIIDYVVVHELAHLREMNHSAAFWAVVGSVVPDYQRRREALRQDHLPSFE